MTKSNLSETDICDKFITPAIQQAGWDLHEQIFRKYTLRPGRVVVRGSTSARDLKSVLRADYVLCHKANIPLAVIEAKDNKHALGAGMAQAINYSLLLDVPFSFSSNGDGFVFRDQTMSSGVLEQNLTLEQFPSPAELWQRFCAWKGWSQKIAQVYEHPYSPSKTPRYYQINAINRTVEAIARGQLPQDPTDEPASKLLQRIRIEKDRPIAEGKVKRGKLLPSIAKQEVPFELPSGWAWVSIDALADVGSGTTPLRDNLAYFMGGRIPWVTSGETGSHFISETVQCVTALALSQTSLTVYPVGTLIVAMYGQGKTRGQVSELRIEAATNQACAAIVLVEPSAAHRSFVKLVFEKSYDEMRDLSAGGAQPNLNVGKIRSTPIPLPPLAEQARIVARVSELRDFCAQLRERLERAEHTQRLLADALVESAHG